MKRLFASTVALLATGCSAPHQAATLASQLSAHVDTLNQETNAFVAQANSMRQASAAQLANQQTRTNSDLAYNATVFTVWRLAGNKKVNDAMDLLEKQAAIDMSTTASDLKKQQDAQNDLTASFGKITYDPKKLQDVVAKLQALAQQDTTADQLQIAQEFAKAVVADMKQQSGSATKDLGKASDAAMKVPVQAGAVSPQPPLSQ